MTKRFGFEHPVIHNAQNVVAELTETDRYACLTIHVRDEQGAEADIEVYFPASRARAVECIAMGINNATLYGTAFQKEIDRAYSASLLARAAS